MAEGRAEHEREVEGRRHAARIPGFGRGQELPGERIPRGRYEKSYGQPLHQEPAYLVEASEAGSILEVHRMSKGSRPVRRGAALLALPVVLDAQFFWQCPHSNVYVPLSEPCSTDASRIGRRHDQHATEAGSSGMFAF